MRLSVGRWLFGCDQLAAAWPKGARSFLLMAGWHWLGQCLKCVKFDISKAKQSDQCAADHMIKKLVEQSRCRKPLKARSTFSWIQMVLAKSKSLPEEPSLGRSTLGATGCRVFMKSSMQLVPLVNLHASLLPDWVTSQCSTWWAVLPSVRSLALLGRPGCSDLLHLWYF